jgi:hypothetical protein
MSSEKTKKQAWNGEEVDILGETYLEGLPQEKLSWRTKLGDRQQMLRYLKTAERYWFSRDWYGSEKRKTPA